jgi:hypothetical protein
MLPILIEQARSATHRRIHGPVAEPPRPRPVRRTVAVVLQRTAYRLDPGLIAPPARIRAA